MVRIAFFTHNAYNMLTDGDDDQVGGAQLQQILVGKELASRGHEVYFVEHDDEGKSETTVDGIEVVLKSRPSGSEPRRGVTQFRETARIIRELDPDVCYRRALDFEIVVLGVLSRLMDTEYVYGMAHDNNLDDTPYVDGIKGTRLYGRVHRGAISSAGAVIAQNDYQYSVAQDRLDTEVYKITNCYEPGSPEPIPELADAPEPVVLWVARFTSFKRPGKVLDVAERVPDARFVVVGNPNDEGLYERTRERAEGLDNVRFEGFVPFSEIDRYFTSADVFLNTSRQEGFPNTFLQSWAYEKPVASLAVDPDGVIERNGLGWVFDDSVEDATNLLSGIATDPGPAREAGERAYQYFVENHSIESVADRYEDVFTSVAGE